MLQQADAQNQFVKEMNNMGAMAGTTSGKLTDLARDAGYASYDLGKLTDIVKGVGTGITLLGEGTASGTEALLGIFNVGDTLEKQMRMYGMTLEETNEFQGFYLNLQRQSGTNLRLQNLKDEKIQKKLQERTLEYTKNLSILAELSGTSADAAKKEQQQATTALQNKIANYQADMDIESLQKDELRLAIALSKETNEEVKKELQIKKNNVTALLKDAEDEKDAREKALLRFSQTLGGDITEQLGRVMRTGAFDDSTKDLSMKGFDPAQLKATMESIDPNDTEAMNKFLSGVEEQYKAGMDRQVEQFGGPMQYMGDAVTAFGEQVGITSNSLDRAIPISDDQEAAYNAAEAGINASTDPTKDRQKGLAADFQVVERNIRTSADRYLDAINPLTESFDKLGAAATAAAIALWGIAAGPLFKTLTGKMNLGSMFGKTPKTPTGPTTIGGKPDMRFNANKPNASTKLLSNASKGLTKMAGPLATVAVGFLSYNEYNKKAAEADRLLKEGLITKTEAADAKAGDAAKAVGSTLGAGIGTAIGALGGPLGMVIGGIVGEAVGSAIGTAYGEMTTSKVVEADLDKAKELDIYDKDRMGNSEVNRDIIAEMLTKKGGAKELTPLIEAMLADNDISDDDQAYLQQQLTDFKELYGITLQRDVDAKSKELELAEAQMISRREQEDLLDKQKMANMSAEDVAKLELETAKRNEERLREDAKLIADKKAFADMELTNQRSRMTEQDIADADAKDAKAMATEKMVADELAKSQAVVLDPTVPATGDQEKLLSDIDRKNLVNPNPTATDQTIPEAVPDVTATDQTIPEAVPEVTATATDQTIPEAVLDVIKDPVDAESKAESKETRFAGDNASDEEMKKRGYLQNGEEAFDRDSGEFRQKHADKNRQVQEKAAADQMKMNAEMDVFEKELMALRPTVEPKDAYTATEGQTLTPAQLAEVSGESQIIAEMDAMTSSRTAEFNSSRLQTDVSSLASNGSTTPTVDIKKDLDAEEKPTVVSNNVEVAQTTSGDASAKLLEQSAIMNAQLVSMMSTLVSKTEEGNDRLKEIVNYSSV